MTVTNMCYKKIKGGAPAETAQVECYISGIISGGNDKDLVKQLGDVMDVNFCGIRMDTTRLGSGQSAGMQLFRVSRERNVTSCFRNVKLCGTLRNSRTSTLSGPNTRRED